MEKRERCISGSLLSVVVPVYNEESNLAELHRRLVATIKSLGCDYEIIFINDGSTDGSAEVLVELTKKDEHVGFISFTRNFGHESATCAGFDFASGDAVVIIDADLQDPPEVIKEMASRWAEGSDIVYGRRSRRTGESASKRASSFIFYRTMRMIADIDIPLDTGDFRLVDRKMVEYFKQLREKNRFVRAEVAWLGGDTSEVLYDRDPRHSGRTKYNFFKRLKLSMDALLSFSAFPLHMVAIVGFVLFALSLIGVLVVFVQKVAFGINVPGYAFLAISILILSGLQLFCIGVLGEYLARVFVEIKDRPLYLVSAVGGFKKRKKDGEGTLP